MTAQEYLNAVEAFIEFGKIQDIDFDLMLHNEPLHNGKVIREINFENELVIVGDLIEFGCDCCGSYYETEMLDLTDLASEGLLGELINMMDQVLTNKIGI
jgi:hypothetical protein